MEEKSIKFSSVRDAERFAEKANLCDFDIDVWYNHIPLDGKSILALLSLDFSRPIKVKYEGDNAQFETFLSSLSASGGLGMRPCACGEGRAE